MPLAQHRARCAIFAYGKPFVSAEDNEFRIEPGRIGDRGSGLQRRTEKLATQVQKASARSGYTRSRRSGKSPRGGSTTHGRGRRALAAMRSSSGQRRVTVLARIVRHKGAHFRSAPLSKHISYLERDGVTRDGRDASMFDAGSEQADPDAFAERCGDDRHHFRLIVSPEDATELNDLRGYTRSLMAKTAKDLDTDLDWVAVDHWNTDNPHIHILVRGVADDGNDLIIDRGYVSGGIRARAQEIATLELGPRSEREIQETLANEVGAERWTSLDRRLQSIADQMAGLIDLRPGGDREMQGLLLGRAATLEKLGIAQAVSSAVWTLEPEAEQTLRGLATRNDIIKTMHQSLARSGERLDMSALALHLDIPDNPVIGRLVDRGLHDELAGSAFAIVDGADGRTHYLLFDDLAMTSDASPGAIVELRGWEDASGSLRHSLAVRSDWALETQPTAEGATWLDRQLVARETVATGNGFGLQIRQAMEERAVHLESRGLAQRSGQRFIFAKNLLDQLKGQDIEQAASAIAARTGLAHRPSGAGDLVSGMYRERVTLASGRFAMLDDVSGFQLVPWRPALERHLGRQLTGTMSAAGSVDWTLGRQKGIGL